MHVVIAGAGSVGRSIARELTRHSHSVTLIDRSPSAMRMASVPDAEWILADACETETLERAEAQECEVVVAATGDDKANLVISLLAKTEFGVPRTVARVNNPRNEWLFTDAWGVDVPVSTPRIMTSLVEEAVSEGDLVRIFKFQRSGSSMYEITLPSSSPFIGEHAQSVGLPGDVVMAAILRDGEPVAPDAGVILQAGDQLLFVISRSGKELLGELQQLLVPQHPEISADDDEA